MSHCLGYYCVEKDPGRTCFCDCVECEGSNKLMQNFGKKTNRKFNVNVSFVFELDEDELKEWNENPTWGYGEYPVGNITLDNVKKELRTCLSSEFCRDEAGLCELPEDFVLTVEEVKD
jgi:hypothetical protein